MTDIKETIERLEGLAEKATPRPWASDAIDAVVGGQYHRLRTRAVPGFESIAREVGSINGTHTDEGKFTAEFVLELVNAFPTLITAFKELEVERDRLREALEAVVDLERAPEPEDDEYGFSSCNVEGFNTALSLAESIALKALEPKP